MEKNYVSKIRALRNWILSQKKVIRLLAKKLRNLKEYLVCTWWSHIVSKSTTTCGKLLLLCEPSVFCLYMCISFGNAELGQLGIRDEERIHFHPVLIMGNFFSLMIRASVHDNNKLWKVPQVSCQIFSIDGPYLNCFPVVQNM